MTDQLIGKDLGDLGILANLRPADLMRVFGIQVLKFQNATKTNKFEPIKDASLSIVVRIGLEYPNLVARQIPSFRNLVDKLEERGIKYSKQQISALFGKEKSSPYRWLGDTPNDPNTARPSGTSNFLIQLLLDFMDNEEIDGQTFDEFLSFLTSQVKLEAESRGFCDPFEHPRGWGAELYLEEKGSPFLRKRKTKVKKNYSAQTISPNDFAAALNIDEAKFSKIIENTPNIIQKMGGPEICSKKNSAEVWWNHDHAIEFASEYNHQKMLHVSEATFRNLFKLDSSQLVLLKRLYKSQFKKKRYFLDDGKIVYYPKTIITFFKSKNLL